MALCCSCRGLFLRPPWPAGTYVPPSGPRRSPAFLSFRPMSSTCLESGPWAGLDGDPPRAVAIDEDSLLPRRAVAPYRRRGCCCAATSSSLRAESGLSCRGVALASMDDASRWLMTGRWARTRQAARAGTRIVLALALSVFALLPMDAAPVAVHTTPVADKACIAGHSIHGRGCMFQQFLRASSTRC